MLKHLTFNCQFPDLLTAVYANQKKKREKDETTKSVQRKNIQNYITKISLNFFIYRI